MRLSDQVFRNIEVRIFEVLLYMQYNKCQTLVS